MNVLVDQIQINYLLMYIYMCSKLSIVSTNNVPRLKYPQWDEARQTAQIYHYVANVDGGNLRFVFRNTTTVPLLKLMIVCAQALET